MTEGALGRYRCVILRRSGAAEIRVVRAESEEAARARLAAAGLDPVSVTAIGPSLFDRLSEYVARRHRPGRPRLPRPAGIALPSRRTVTGTALLLATIPVSSAIAAWGLAGFDRWQAARLAGREAPAIAAYGRAVALGAARREIAGAMTAPPLAAIAARLGATLPEEAGLAAMAFERGELIIEIETPDPDRLRGALAGDPLLGALSETGQTVTAEGTIRVTLRGRV